MKAKRVIPATLMGLGALTAYLLYAGSQKKAIESIAVSITEVKTKKEQTSKKAVKVSSLKPDTTVKKPAPKKKITPEKTDTKTNTSSVKKDPDVNLDKALKPVLSITYAEKDLKTFVKAYEYLRKNRITHAKRLSKKISDPLIRKCLQWYLYKSNPDDISTKKLTKFWRTNPDWPQLDAMKAAVESDLLSKDVKTIKAYLDKEEPVSAAGLLAKAIVLQKEGKKEEALEIVRVIWHRGKPSRSLDKFVIKRFGKLLTKEDRHIRAQRYLYEGKSKYVAAALGVAKKLDKSTRKTLDVHIALLRRSRSAKKKVQALPAKDKLTPNVLYARIKQHRKRKQYKKAWALLKKAPSTPGELVDPEAWWVEKRRLIREAMNKKKYKVAYDIAKNHGQVSANQLIDAEFLAGWISLRYLKKPKIGYKHFLALRKAADGPRSRSRSHYWLGRAALAMGKKSKAKEHFLNGAKYFNTFYGQLSRQSVDPNDRLIQIEISEKPTAADVKRFQNRDAVKIIIMADQAKQHYLVARFFHSLRYAIKEPGELILLAELAKRTGYTQQSVRIGKTAMFYGHKATKYSYPTHAMPKFKPLGKLPEKAFSYAIARQESEFNTKIKSHAGALGLMQVMPATARLLARRHKVKYNKKKLANDAGYNVRLGAVYITERLRESNGSYIKTIAGYNAGPGRVSQWVKQFGDPSHKNIDPIDWIERIPFHETRNYVQKVLSNMQMYRALLGNPENALQLRRDLYRSRKDAHKAKRSLIAAK